MKTQFKIITMYNEVKNLFESDLNKTQIGKKMGIDRKTVRKYLSMNDEAFSRMLEGLKHRTLKLMKYEVFVYQRISLVQNCSAAQVEDWLKEYHPDLPQVSSRTVYSFVQWIRAKYNLPKPGLSYRQCHPIEKLPYGEQAQVDFGEFWMKTPEGKRVKVYFMLMVLSRSRQKFIWFTIQSINTYFVIEAHENAFAFFKGIVRTIVFDQDSTILTDENLGDLIYTEEFSVYVKQRGFGVYMCRKADPQTKGKVENGIGFAKKNFLHGRPFCGIDLLNQDGIKWLSRTGNAKVHATTRLVPEREWLIEKQYLREFIPLPIKPDYGKSYGVRKDNTISYRGNFYSLPTDTYQGPKTHVMVRVSGSELIICGEDKIMLASHVIQQGRGEIIVNNHHRRDVSEKIQKLILELCQQFNDPGHGKTFLEKIHLRLPRYSRDHFLMLRKAFRHYPPELMNQSLDYCLKHKLFSGGEFCDVVKQLVKKENSDDATDLKDYKPVIPFGDLASVTCLVPETSNINDYQKILH